MTQVGGVTSPRLHFLSGLGSESLSPGTVTHRHAAGEISLSHDHSSLLSLRLPSDEVCILQHNPVSTMELGGCLPGAGPPRLLLRGEKEEEADCKSCRTVSEHI